jgi:soluble lytic murein transglycosylase
MSDQESQFACEEGGYSADPAESWPETPILPDEDRDVMTEGSNAVEESLRPERDPESEPFNPPWIVMVGLSVLMFCAGAGWALLGAQAEITEMPLPPAQDFDPTDPTVLSQESINRFRQAYQSLQSGQARLALTQMEGLETELPILIDHLLMMRAMASQQLLDPTAATEYWQQLRSQFPDSSLVPHALLGLNHQELLVQAYPRHPVTGELAEAALTQDPTQIQWLRLLVHYHPNRVKTPVVDQWIRARPETLTLEDWQAVSDLLWDQREYGKASQTYGRAPITSRNLYRYARSHHLSKNYGEARVIYQRLLTEFPDSEDTPLGRRRLAEISDSATAIALLRPLAAQSLPESADALLDLSKLYEKNKSPQSAQVIRQELWQRFPESEAAVEAAWDHSWSLAKAGQKSAAITVAQHVGLAQEDTEMGAQLAYWAGKWQSQLGNPEAARQLYQQVLTRFPHTYYAWRAAVQLGLPVGDFKVGRFPVQVTYKPAKLTLPVGSPQVQALHLMSLPELAWQRWQWEVDIHHQELSPEEIFVTGFLRNTVNEHLKGINQVSSLRFKAGAEALRQREDFWQAMYPLHFHDSASNAVGGDPLSQKGIAQWSKQYQLNPLLVAALIRQESRFEADIVSRSGALGLMQVMPATGKWIGDQLGISQFQLTSPADNLHFGSWYLDYTHRTYQDNSMLAVASYNGGPGSVAKWLKQFGLSDPDLFVEQIPFTETRGYVKAVFGNYWNYWQLYTAEGKAFFKNR